MGRVGISHLLLVRHLYDAATLATHIHETRQFVGGVLDHPRPLYALRAAGAHKFDFYLFDAGVHSRYHSRNDLIIPPIS